MPEVARKDGQDSISTGHGCDATTVTDEGSSRVFVNGYGVVRSGDKTAVHLIPSGPSCVPHTVPLSSFSPNVYADGKNIGRKGDKYNGHTLTSGSTNVFAN